MSATLCLRNRQRLRPVEARVLRRIVRHLIAQHFRPEHFELCLHLVEAPEMARLNGKFLGHGGSTDVITFNYMERNEPNTLQADIFICLDEAIAQARQFRTTWQSEVIRYAIHARLHLNGVDDAKPAERRTMKREEDRLLREASCVFDFRRLARQPPGAKRQGRRARRQAPY